MNMPQISPALSPLLTIKDLQDLLGRSRASIYRDIAAGHLPQPTKLGKSSRWKQQDILRVMNEGW